MALKGSTSGETTTDNTLSYSSISGDATVCEQQFTRLKTFLHETNSVHGTDLLNVLFPVFVHMYIELLNNGHKTPAHKFFSRHSGLFRTDDQHHELLEVLSKLYSRTDIMGCKQVLDFREMKYNLNVSQEAFEALQRHLKVEDNMIMLQIFNQHICLQEVLMSSEQCGPRSDGKLLAFSYLGPHCSQKVTRCAEKLQDYMTSLPVHMKMLQSNSDDYNKVQVKSDTSSFLGLKNDRSDGKRKQPISPAYIPDNKVVHDDQALSSLKQVIKEVREGPPGLPSICFYSFLNAYQGLCCASVSRNNEYLSGGFEDSSTRVWQLSPGLFPQADTSDGPSTIYLSADYINSTRETADEEEGQEECNTELECISLKGHTGSVYQASFMWDSKYLLTCSEDTTVRLWNTEKQRCMVIYRGHNYPVWDLDTSSKGDYFASCSHDQTAKLWSTERVYPLRSFIGHTYDVDCVRFHPNCNYIATGSGDKTVRLWSIQEGKSVRLLQGHKSSVLSLAFSPNGMLLASAGEDRRVRVWDLRTGLLFKEFRGHTDTIHTLSFNQTSSMLASGGLDSCIRIWDLRRSAGATIPGVDSHNSPELLGAFATKSTPVTYLNFTDHNVLQAAGAV